jgi:hypothetical protein
MCCGSEPESKNFCEKPKIKHLKAGLWIRIGSGLYDFVDPDPDTRKMKKQE